MIKCPYCKKKIKSIVIIENKTYKLRNKIIQLCKEKSLNINELAKITGIAYKNMHKTIKLLEKEGYIKIKKIGGLNNPYLISSIE